MSIWKRLLGLDTLGPVAAEPAIGRYEHVINFVNTHLAACGGLMQDRLQNMSGREERGYLAFTLGVLEYCGDTVVAFRSHDPGGEAEAKVASADFVQFLTECAKGVFPQNHETVLGYWLTLMQSNALIPQRKLGFDSANDYSNPDGTRRVGYYPGRNLKEALDISEHSGQHVEIEGEQKPDVLCAIGVAFAKGDKVPQDFVRAVDFYRRAAEKGFAPALMLLAMAYDGGKGVPKSHAEALKWYRKAADAGDPYGQLAVGNAHYNGFHALQDFEEAARWYSKAANQGVPGAQLQLGKMYASGLGVAPDNIEAYKWLNLAAATQDRLLDEIRDEAVQHRAEVVGRMSPAQVTEAQRRSREWMST